MAAPVIFFSDLDSGPKTGGENNAGVWVTIYGKRFGASRGSGGVTVGGGAVSSYKSWSDTKVVFDLGASAATGNIVLTTNGSETSNGIPFTVRSGSIYFVSTSGTGAGTYAAPMPPADVYDGIAAGDTYYFRSGTYSSQYGQFGWADASWCLGSSKDGTSGNPVAFVGYPGETATFSGRTTFYLRDSSETVADYITIANLTMVGDNDCIGGGAITSGGSEVENSGGKYIRVIGCRLSATYGTANTMTGLISCGGDGWRMYGNELHDTGSGTPVNNNHGIYIQVGASNIDVGWNWCHDLKMGHVIQIHTDTPFLYEGVNLHDNLLTAVSSSDCRGLNVGETVSGSYGNFYNNVLVNVGQSFSAIAVYSGDWNIYNNTTYNIGAACLLISTADGTAVARNNIWHVQSGQSYIATEGGASMSQVTLSNNCYYGNGNGPTEDSNEVNDNPDFISTSDYHLQSTSPCIGAGTTLVNGVVTRDYDGLTRGAAYDIGAYEYEAASLLAGPANFRWRPH